MSGPPPLRGTALRVVDPLVIRDEEGRDVIGTLREGGRSSGVVLVHGIVGSRRLQEIDRVAVFLSAEHDTLAIDVLGHGDSPGRFTWGRDEWRQVDAAVRHLAAGGRRVAVVGFSFGGYHGARAAARGAPVERLVLVGAPADRHVLDHFPIGPAFFRNLPAMTRRRRSLPRMASLRWPREGMITAEEIARVTCPVLVIHGTGDWLVSKRHADRWMSGLRRAELLEIPGGFHAEYLMASHPAALLEALRRFLAASGTMSACADSSE